MPSVLAYVDGGYFMYDGNKASVNELLHFINKIINPIVNLNTDEEI